MSEGKMFDRNGVWYIWVKTTDPNTGKRKRIPKSTGIHVGRKADKLRAEIEGEKLALAITLGTHHSTLTVEDAHAANYDAKVAASCASASFEILKEKWPHITAHFGDDRLLKTITDADMIAYAAQAKTGTNPRSPGSITREIKELYRGMRILGITPPKFPDVGKLGKGTRQLGRAQIAKLLSHVTPRWREHVLMYRLTGMRKGELYLIEAHHINIEEWMLTVPGADTANGDDGRTIPVHEQLRPILLQRMQDGATLSKPRTGPLFELWTNADRDLRKAGEDAGLGPVSFNTLKASFGAEMLRAGVPTREVAEFYGHSSTRMVEEHYNRLVAGKHLDRALSKVKSIAIEEEGSDDA